MDQVYQVMYGPIQDKLKYAGTAWLVISVISILEKRELSGYVGLLAILAAINSSIYLLRLTLILGPLSVIVAIYYLLNTPKSFAWVLLQLIHFVIQGATIWWAWQYHQELGGQEGYDVPREAAPAGGRGQATHSDPFQAYQPPPGQQSTIYAPEPAEQPRAATPQNRKDEDPRGENLL